MTAPFSDHDRNSAHPGPVPSDNPNFLTGANFAPGFYRNAPTRLSDGVVFVLDDQPSQMRFYRLLLTSKFHLREDSVQTINPTKLQGLVALKGESPSETILRETIKPVIAAATSRDRMPSLVITDYEMGPVNGQEVIAALRSHFNGHPPFKILLNSSTAGIQNSVTGHDYFIPKPVHMTALRSAIRELFPAGV